MEEVYTVEEIAEMLGVHKQTVMYEICQSKRLRAFKVGRKWHVTRSAYREFIGEPERVLSAQTEVPERTNPEGEEQVTLLEVEIRCPYPHSLVCASVQDLQNIIARYLCQNANINAVVTVRPTR